ncbi:uncharacterized protein Z519_02036 [Cladophialophora bantiana CBS 173.52]|uniref:Uncharacterized protein n=1 Tax=Cladophialophora bantiana (strain ATCC 10958 / CBS 173.52 / CDC B-1940 / NIH 8579) TaxID=1442370 RepID=A0A0D2I0F6_CLAB1|nr:uncharacterized protein Z519_02036 [Cladophialophora bantiana CBS 173.52]KIW96645.1 hypothetical protein Z519_02036 [Cladophialophora bantiana CBS 173.52]
MSSGPNTHPANDMSTRKSMAVSSTRVGDSGAVAVGDIDSATGTASSQLLRFQNSPPQSDPWHPNRADRRHLHHLITKVDGIMSVIDGLGTGC